MDARHIRTFLIGILASGLLSTVALADPTEDMARANNLYDNEQMMDAILIFKKLAEQNYLPAQSRLGEMLDYTEADEEAVGWYIMAAAQGDPAGAFGLGRMYLSGEGIKKDPDQALYWIKFAAEKDDLNALKVMEHAYRTGADSGLKVAVDLKQAQYWEAKKIPVEAAALKVKEAQRQAYLKKLYEKQEALKKESKEAAKNAGKGQTK